MCSVSNNEHEFEQTKSGFIPVEQRSARPSYLCHVEQKCDGVVEVGVGATSVDPEVPENWEKSRTRQQDAGHQEDVPQNWTRKPGEFLSDPILMKLWLVNICFKDKMWICVNI